MEQFCRATPEFATSAHENFLLAHGLLDSGSRIKGGAPFPVGGDGNLFQGLIIDDFFAISSRSLDYLGVSDATSALLCAKEAYRKAGIAGSDEKGLVDAETAVVAGAEVDTSPHTRALGLGLVGPSRSKRIALVAITLELARRQSTPDHLHLCLVGGCVSGMLYRRPFMSILNGAFTLVDASTVSQSSPKILGLPRCVADELVLAASLCHTLVADI